MPELNARDQKLVLWLNQAHAKEAELEADLTAHIALTQKMSYKKRLRQHLTETKDHKRRLAARIKQLGGTPSTGPNLPGVVPDVVGEVAGKAGRRGQGPGRYRPRGRHRTGRTHLRNAQEELREEHVEIAIYSRIVTFAEEVRDRDTARLAKAIRRDEERMAKFLDAEARRAWSSSSCARRCLATYAAHRRARGPAPPRRPAAGRRPLAVPGKRRRAAPRPSAAPGRAAKARRAHAARQPAHAASRTPRRPQKNGVKCPAPSMRRATLARWSCTSSARDSPMPS